LKREKRNQIGGAVEGKKQVPRGHGTKRGARSCVNQENTLISEEKNGYWPLQEADILGRNTNIPKTEKGGGGLIQLEQDSWLQRGGGGRLSGKQKVGRKKRRKMRERGGSEKFLQERSFVTGGKRGRQGELGEKKRPSTHLGGGREREKLVQKKKKRRALRRRKSSYLKSGLN